MKKIGQHEDFLYYQNDDPNDKIIYCKITAPRVFETIDNCFETCPYCNSQKSIFCYGCWLICNKCTYCFNFITHEQPMMALSFHENLQYKPDIRYLSISFELMNKKIKLIGDLKQISEELERSNNAPSGYFVFKFYSQPNLTTIVDYVSVGFYQSRLNITDFSKELFISKTNRIVCSKQYYCLTNINRFWLSIVDFYLNDYDKIL